MSGDYLCCAQAEDENKIKKKTSFKGLTCKFIVDSLNSLIFLIFIILFNNKEEI